MKYLLFWLFAFSANAVWAQPTFEQFYQKGLAALKQKKWNKAEQMANKTLKIDDSHVAAYCLRAAVAMHNNEAESALSDYHTAINLAPNADSLYLLRSEAWVAYAMGGLQAKPCNCGDDAKRLFNSLDESAAIDMREALNDALKAAELNPLSARANYRCGWLLHIFSQKDEACASFKKALEQGHPDAKQQLTDIGCP